jgi:ATP-binding cassette subfamily E protein 1
MSKQSNRIAIVNQEKCKPDKCKKECINFCPPQLSGKEVIKLTDIEDVGLVKLSITKTTDKKKIAKIIESMCIGCNICVHKCPFNAIKIVNLPYENKADIIHRFGVNGFRLYKLPILRTNCVMGILGQNGVGKTTLINILSDILKPNFESSESFDIKKISSKFRGSVSFEYLKKLYSGKLKISIKSQKIKSTNFNSNVKTYLQFNNIDLEKYKDILEQLEIVNLFELNMDTLSGGELQRIMCGVTICSESDVYIFDEPSNYLDIKQRLLITKQIRNLINPDKYIIVIDHDLAILDYIADTMFILYGHPSAFGIVSNPLTTLDGINMYLDGYIPSENIRFRPDAFNLKTPQEFNDSTLSNDTSNNIKYLGDTIEYPNFKLIIPDGSINLSSSINVILGSNGNGKTTFIKYLAKKIEGLVSYKEQTLNITKYKSNELYLTVNQLFYKFIMESYHNSTFIAEVVKPLDIEEIKERRLDELSGGELQRVLIILCLGTPASIYLIDEPSANLDIEKRLIMIKVIKRFIINNKKCGFIIEHDMMMAVSFAQEQTSNIILIDKVVNNSISLCNVSPLLSFNVGINKFLKTLDITMRIGEHNRPRINKLYSQMEKTQKETNNYYI